MTINTEVFEKVESYHAQVLVVTKYLDANETTEVIDKLKNRKSVIGFGENRIEQIESKKIPRELCHFIGNLQSRKLKEISQNCSVIHSLYQIKHGQMLNELGNQLEIFIQINISGEGEKQGLDINELESFLKKIKELHNLKVVGISAMGRGEFNEDEKRKEFKTLIELRNKFVPDGKISAGTSRDFEIALEEGIEIVRVGMAIFE